MSRMSVCHRVVDVKSFVTISQKTLLIKLRIRSMRRNIRHTNSQVKNVAPIVNSR